MIEVRPAMKMMRCIAIGVGVALVALALQVPIALYLPSSSPAKRVVLGMNWPAIAFLDWYARTFKNGNTDQMLGPWLLLIPGYWVVLGAVTGTAYGWLRSRKLDKS